jgi:hypothetical protein
MVTHVKGGVKGHITCKPNNVIIDHHIEVVKVLRNTMLKTKSMKI